MIFVMSAPGEVIDEWMPISWKISLEYESRPEVLLLGQRVAAADDQPTQPGPTGVFPLARCKSLVEKSISGCNGDLESTRTRDCVSCGANVLLMGIHWSPRTGRPSSHLPICRWVIAPCLRLIIPQSTILSY
jgi:hypothetical protein